MTTAVPFPLFVMLWGYAVLTTIATPSLQHEHGTYLLIGNGPFISTVNLDGRRVCMEGPSDDSTIVGIDFDYRDQYWFWSDALQKSLRMSNFSAVGITTLISSGTTMPYDIAWDWINQKLYWTDFAEQEIEVYDFINFYRKVILYTGNTSAPLGIAVDPQNGWLYWTDVSGPGKIERASMDGTSRMVLHDTGLSLPTGITIDYASQTLYWIDAITLPKIESSGVDGSNRQTVIAVDFLNSWGIVYYNRTLYWTDTTNGSYAIYTASTESIPLPRNLLNFTFPNSPFGIQAVSSARQPQGTNPCGNSNGGCQYICLLSSEASDGYTCACPDDLVQDSSGRNCLVPSRGQLRLVQGNYTSSTLTSGRLEIYLNGQWGTVCDDLWGQDESDVACQQLGYVDATGFGRSVNEGFAIGRGPIWLDDVVCVFGETTLLSCLHGLIGNTGCTHSEDIGLHCRTTTGLSTAAITGIAIAAILAAIGLFMFFCFVTICCCIFCRHSQSKAISSPQSAPTYNEYMPPTVPQRQPQQQQQQQPQQQQYSGHEPIAHPPGYSAQAPLYLGYSVAPLYQQEVGMGGTGPYSPLPPPTQFPQGAGIEGISPYSQQPAPSRGTVHSLSAYTLLLTPSNPAFLTTGNEWHLHDETL